MKTTININGLDVEFTDEVPTRVGARYLLLDDDDWIPALVFRLSDRAPLKVLIPGDHKARILTDIGGLWSAPLVLVTEVEKMREEVERAYVEGYDDAGGSGYNMTLQWKTSNARKVVEGCR